MYRCLAVFSGKVFLLPGSRWAEVALLRREFKTAANNLPQAPGILHGEGRLLLMMTLSRSMSDALFECGEILEAQGYDRFTEGYKTYDLRTARHLLEVWRPAAREELISD